MRIIPFFKFTEKSLHYPDTTPHQLKHEILRPIEERLGRIRKGNRYGPRTIDIDLLLFDELVVNEDRLLIPDPELTRQNFLLVPAQKIAGDMLHPIDHRRLKDYPSNAKGLTLIPITVKPFDSQV